jgi:hypothetical protein
MQVNQHKTLWVTLELILYAVANSGSEQFKTLK